MILEQHHNQHQSWQQRIDWVLWESDYEFPQFIMALPLLGWAIVLLLPGNTFITSPAFSTMDFWPETWWGALSGMLFCCYTISGILQWQRTFAAVSFLASLWWLFVSVSIYLALPLSTGTAIYPVVFVNTGWVFLRYMARHDVLRRTRERR